MGVIVCGYQGIGKSTVAKEIPNVIDLESSNFYRADEKTRPDDWAYFYVKIAIDQALRGNDVLLSCHESVREQLYLQYHELCDEDRTYVAPLVIIPAMELKKEWQNKLVDRYCISLEPKDRKAYEFHANEFETVVNAISNALLPYPLPTIFIRDINYDLRALVYDYLNYADDKYNCSIFKWRKRGRGGLYARRSEVCPES